MLRIPNQVFLKFVQMDFQDSRQRDFQDIFYYVRILNCLLTLDVNFSVIFLGLFLGGMMNELNKN